MPGRMFKEPPHSQGEGVSSQQTPDLAGPVETAVGDAHWKGRTGHGPAHETRPTHAGGAHGTWATHTGHAHRWPMDTGTRAHAQGHGPRTPAARTPVIVTPLATARWASDLTARGSSACWLPGSSTSTRPQRPRGEQKPPFLQNPARRAGSETAAPASGFMSGERDTEFKMECFKQFRLLSRKAFFSLHFWARHLQGDHVFLRLTTLPFQGRKCVLC